MVHFLALLSLIIKHQPGPWNFITLRWPKRLHANVSLEKHPRSAKPKTIHEHVCYSQRSTPPNLLFVKDDLPELGSVRVPLTCTKGFWNLSNAAIHHTYYCFELGGWSMRGSECQYSHCAMLLCRNDRSSKKRFTTYRHTRLPFVWWMTENG